MELNIFTQYTVEEMKRALKTYIASGLRPERVQMIKEELERRGG